MYVYECVSKWCKQWCNALSVRLRQVLRRKILCVAYYNIKRYRFFLESRTVLELKSVKPIIHSQIRSTILWGFSKIEFFVRIGPMKISVQSRSGPKFEKKTTHKRVLKDISSWSNSVLVRKPLAILNIYSGEIRHFNESPESFRFVPTCDSVSLNTEHV